MEVESEDTPAMAHTQHLHYASNHQPAIAVRALLRDPAARTLLRRLRGRSLSLKQLDLGGEGVRVLRRLRSVGLVTAYAIGGVTKYRARRWPPAVTAALAA